jgi:RimJ/RimL family protein N-acetyltransferase
LRDGFRRHGWEEVLSYTAPDNIRSQAVMGRLGLARAPDRDFVANYDTVAAWTGLVWVARPEMDWS